MKFPLGIDIQRRVEQIATVYFGDRWRVERRESRADQASHPAVILSDGERAVFVKMGTDALAVDRFRQEETGLQLLTACAGVRTPAVMAIVAIPDGALMIMEGVQEVPRTSDHWRQMGQTLAQVHACPGVRFGLETHCYWGDLYQDNRPLNDWPEFFWRRRVEPRLQAAVDTGHLPLGFVKQFEQLQTRLTSLCGPVVTPALLHGDAHSNNILSTAQGPVLIDPAVYYGHPEMDLSYVDFFAPVPDEFWQGYRGRTALAAGFQARRELWRLPAWLAMVQVDGPHHVDALRRALSRYL